jgi:membrane-bound lytic murein transglycosylase B
VHLAWIALLTLAVAQPPDAPRPSFSEWLAGVRAEALSRGIREDIVDAALANIPEPLSIVIERDRTQAETVLPLETYIARRLTAKVLKAGREMQTRHRELLDEVSARYGVPPRIILGVWGLESNFGRFSGVRPTVSALATLAWDPRRSAFFRGELFSALEILNRGDIDLADMRGSWAGAMGQVQFMPSSYLQFAEDFNGDGRRDIWATPGDVFASIANYLKGHGWVAGSTWGREVLVTPEVARRVTNDVARRNGPCQAMRDMTVALPMSRWQELGVRLPAGKALPATALEASLVSGRTRHFLVYGNYDALLGYNCAHSYAVSVALLGDALARGGTPAPPAGSPRPGTKRRQ